MKGELGHLEALQVRDAGRDGLQLVAPKIQALKLGEAKKRLRKLLNLVSSEVQNLRR